KIYVILDGEPVTRETTFARAIGYTVDSRDRYVTEFEAPDGSKFTLRISHDVQATDRVWKKAIDDALDTEHGLVLLTYTGDNLTNVQDLASVDAAYIHTGQVVKLTSTQITVDVDPDPTVEDLKTETLAPDVFWWDDDAKEFIRRTDIFKDDEVKIWTHPDTKLVTVVFLNPVVTFRFSGFDAEQANDGDEVTVTAWVTARVANNGAIAEDTRLQYRA